MANPTSNVLPQPFIQGVYPSFSELTLVPSAILPPGASLPVLSAAGAAAARAVQTATGVQLTGQTGLKELRYGDKMTPEYVYANDPAPIGRTRGRYDATAGMQLYLPQWYAFIELLTRIAAWPAYGEIAFDLQANYVIGSEQFPVPVQAQLKGCRIIGSDITAGSGDQSALYKVIPLHVMSIIENGKTLYSGTVANAFAGVVQVA